MGAWAYEPECTDDVRDFYTNRLAGSHWDKKMEILRREFTKNEIDNVYWYAGVVRLAEYLGAKKQRIIPNDIWERVYIALRLSPLSSYWSEFIIQEKGKETARGVYKTVLKETLSMLSPFERRVMLKFVVNTKFDNTVIPKQVWIKYLEFKKKEKVRTKTVKHYTEVYKLTHQLRSCSV